MSIFTIRPLLNDADWQDAMAIRAALHPEFPFTAEEYKAEDALFEDKVHLRRLICDGEEAVGMVLFLEAFFYTDPNGFVSRVIARPDRLDVFRFGFEQIARWAEEHNAALVHCGVEDRYSEIVALAQGFGFWTKQEQKVSRLDVKGFSRQNSSLDFEIVSLTQLKEMRPDTWLHDFWRLEMDILKDVPMTGEFKEDPIEMFEKFLSMPGVDPDGIFLALVDGALAGVSGLGPSLSDPKIGITGLTGVRREHRRKGIAQALKTVSINWGKAKGIEFVMTDNEEKNPMYLLNEQLGFRHVFNQLAMVWRRQPEAAAIGERVDQGGGEVAHSEAN
jgi:GNAT superfamily N-acetyltransferase